MDGVRIKKLQETLQGDFEAALIQTQSNRFYLLDFDSSDAGTLLILPSACYYFVDARYIESAENKVKTADVILQKNLYAQMKEILQKEGVGLVHIERECTLAQYDTLKEKLPEFAFDKSDALTSALRRLRAVKDEEELCRIRKAQTITDACFAHILPRIAPGVREVDLMLEMEHFMRANGAESVAFDTIFLCGANTSLPHGRPGETRLKKGDFITMDFGAKYRGYNCDMTRTVALGKPSEKQREVYEVVKHAQWSALQNLRAGLISSEVDTVARDLIRKAGYAECFGHGLGHAVGIDIHEEPRLSPLCDEKVLPGMVLTVEPGIYLPKQFGCRIEDTVVVGERGCEALPSSPKELLIL